MFGFDAPLGMAPGSVRSLLAFAVVGAFIGGLIGSDVALLVLGAYFMDRASSASPV